MASGFYYVRDTKKGTVTLNGTSMIVNKLNLPFGIKMQSGVHVLDLPKIPVIDVGTYYDNVDNPIEITTPILLNDVDDGGYDLTFEGLTYAVLFVPINAEETEFGMLIMTK